MKFSKDIKNYPASPHKGLEKTVSVLTTTLGAAAFVVLLQTSADSPIFGVADMTGPLLLVGSGGAALLLKWLQGYRYADTPSKRHPLDERQMQLRLKVYYRSFFIVTGLFSFFVMALVTNSFDVMNRISTNGAALTALSIAWLCFTLPSVVAAWTKDA